MKRKLLATLLSVAMATTLLAGCGSGSTEAPAAADSSSETTDTASTEAPAADVEVQEITWMFWDDLNATEDLISKGYADVIDRFNTEYAGQYHVTPITTNLEEYYPKLNALVASGDVPDVFIVSPGPNLTDYVEPGVAAPLDSYLADGWKDTFTSDAVFSQQTYDGQIYAVPLNIAAACCFYNTEMFEAAGAKVPTNWSEMLDACEKLQAAGYTPITISAGTAWCLSMVAGYLCESKGVDLAAIADGSDTWENGKLEAAATDLVELSKYFQKTAAGDTNDVATANFYNEEAAILIQGSWAIGQINGENPDFESKCGVFQFPGVERVIAKSDSLAMSSTSKCPEACVALMKMFTDDTAQKYTAEVGGKIPVTNVEYDANVAPAQLAYVMDVFRNASSTFGFYNESLADTEAGSTFDNCFVEIFKGTDPATALQPIQDYYEMNVW